MRSSAKKILEDLKFMRIIVWRKKVPTIKSSLFLSKLLSRSLMKRDSRLTINRMKNRCLRHTIKAIISCYIRLKS